MPIFRGSKDATVSTGDIVATQADIAAAVTLAENAQAAAEAAQAIVQTIAGDFDNLYLGPLSSDPSTRDDGSALQAGDLYFNTTSDRLQIYDGTQWEITARDDSDIRSLFSGGGDITYNSTTGEFSVTIYTDSDVDAHLSGGTGVTYTSGTISIGQDVGTTDDVIFNSITVNEIDCGSIV